jgi:hypothetical protein
MSEQKHHLLPLFQESEVLFGHDGTTGLIACESAGNDSEEENPGDRTGNSGGRLSTGF